MGGVKVNNPMQMVNPMADGDDSDYEDDDDQYDVEPVSVVAAPAPVAESVVLADEKQQWGLIITQTLITLVFAPVAFFWVFGVCMDIVQHWQDLRPSCVGVTDWGDACLPQYNNHTNVSGVALVVDTYAGQMLGCEPGCEDRAVTRFSFEFVVMMIMPAMSFWGSCYMLVTYWMDESSWTLLRTRLMYANIPMCVFFGMMLVGQANYRFGMSCQQMAAVMQVTYGMMNLWQTMTIITAYRFVVLGKGRLVGWQQFLVHLVCWGFPILTTGTMYLLDDDVFHDNIFAERDMGFGMGWCGVRSDRRVLKAIFVNTPQLICVSLYAQYYSYIHFKIDPPLDTNPLNIQSRVVMSKNAALMGAVEKKLANYEQELAEQLRRYMTAYMLSFLTNTVLQLVGDNYIQGVPARWNLMLQAAVVTPQGWLIAAVYRSSVENSLKRCYLNVAIKFFQRRGSDEAVEKIKMCRDANFLPNSEKITLDPLFTINLLGLRLGEWWTTIMLMPVGILVWAPLEFLEEMMEKGSAFVGLIVFSIFVVFPFYWFRQDQTIGKSEDGAILDQNPLWYLVGAQGYLIAVIVISALGVWKSRFAYRLNQMEGAVRRRGLLASIGEGIRLNSARNVMSVFTTIIEFYQTWGLAWSTSRMGDRYDLDSSAETDGSGSDEKLDNSATNMRFYWLSVIMVLGWAILYSLPSVITTVSVGHRLVAYNLSESYRKYLWWMSGAGFLTLLKALMRVYFCIEDPYGRMDYRNGQNGTNVMLVPMIDYSLHCWEETHLQLVALSCLCFVIFFPSASLTCLFRYDDEDNRPFFNWGKKNEKGQLVAEGYFPCHGGCVLGGEDIRWVHIWRRVEYMVKAVWVFSSFKFSGYGSYEEVNPGIFFLLAGSCTIGFANYIMSPSNLSYFTRAKLLIHICNVWTTLTCTWAITMHNTDKAVHLSALITGWVMIVGGMLCYESWQFKTDVFRQAVGDESNQERCEKEILMCRQAILANRGLKRWGNHRKITRIFRLAEHPDDNVKKAALDAISVLAYQDQMTGASMQMNTSNFLFYTPVYPAVETFLQTIEGRTRDGEPITDPATRNFATQSLVVYLQANVWNTSGALKSFYQGVDDYVNMRQQEDGVSVVHGFVEYITQCEDPAHRMDALLLLLNFCKVDTNHLVKVCDHALPLLKNLLDNGNIIEQYVATTLTLMIAERSDLACQLIDSGLMASVIALFHLVMEQYKNGELVEGGATGFKKAKQARSTKPLCKEYILQGCNLPIRLKELFMRNKTDGVAGGVVSVDAELTMKEGQLLTMMGKMMNDGLACVVECANGVDHAGKRHLIELGALDIMKRCFDFGDVGNLTKTVLDKKVEAELSGEALRASHAFLCGPFAERDIDVDPDYKVFNGMLARFKESVESGEDANGAKEFVEPIFEFDTGLTPAQRKKAHKMCEYHGLSHLSIGVGIARRVVATWEDAPVKNQITNPMNALKSNDDIDGDLLAHQQEADGSYMARFLPQGSILLATASGKDSPNGGRAAERPRFYQNDEKSNLKFNYGKVGAMGLGKRLLVLYEASKHKSTSDVMFHIVDLMLLLLENGMLTADQRDTVRSAFLLGLANDNVGMSVMGATGMEIFCVQNKTFAEIGHRRAKYLDGKDGSPKKMFKWAGHMVYWIWFWKIHSGNMGLLTPEEELAKREEEAEEEKRLAAGGKAKKKKKSNHSVSAPRGDDGLIAGPAYDVRIRTKMAQEAEAAEAAVANPAADLEDKD